MVDLSSDELEDLFAPEGGALSCSLSSPQDDSTDAEYFFHPPLGPLCIFLEQVSVLMSHSVMGLFACLPVCFLYGSLAVVVSPSLGLFIVSISVTVQNFLNWI